MTVGQKVAANTLEDRIQARRALYTKKLFELVVPVRDHIPESLERLGRRALRGRSGPGASATGAR
jgi:hypothetical protein